jgi:23S rRNA (guanine745-N1)-methyltransferase
MPIVSGWADCVTSIFVPSANQEIHRVLKENGIWITVGPGPMHVYELKEVMYEHPYKNEIPNNDYSGFEKIHQEIITQKHLVEDCMALLDMTPYRYKSSKEAIERVSQLKTAEITFEFVITVWRKL